VKVKQTLHIQWMILRDMPEVLDIEAASFSVPWDEGDFRQHLRQRNCIGMVAEQDERVVGYMVYELNKTTIHVLNFAVAQECRRRGIGTSMVDKLKGKLSSQRRNRLVVNVNEKAVETQVFFRECGFRAVAILRDYAEDGSTAYTMAYWLRGMAIPETED